MSAPTRYALIGATGIGAFHLAALRKIEETGALRVVAVADPALANDETLGADLTARGAAVHLDYRDMLRGETGIDVVVISAPIPLHFEMTAACLERGLFVYLEKPPVPLIQQLEALLARKGQERVGVGFQMINARWVQELKAGIVAGALGRLEEIRIGACWPRLDAYYARNSAAGKMTVSGEPVFDGPATNALAHLIHNAMFFAGETQAGFGVPDEVSGALYRTRAIESYDVASLRARFSSGLRLTAALTHATEKTFPFQVEVRGSEGRARISGDGTIFESPTLSFDPRPETFEDLVEKTHRQFLAFVRGDQPAPATTLEDTRGYLLATNGLLLSSGGIHPVAADSIRTYQRGAEGGYDVAGLYGAVQASVETGKLFTELGLPWAVETPAVPVGHLKKIDFPPPTLG
jgi:predicted dehydrogenase